MEFQKGRIFKVDDIEPFFQRHGTPKQPLPNAEPMDPIEFLRSLASFGHSWQPIWGYTQLPGSSRSMWTQLFLSTYMMSGLDGTGYAVTYGGPGDPIVRRFAICKHKKIKHADADPRRGWHPGHCELCGFDMTYDSGD